MLQPQSSDTSFGNRCRWVFIWLVVVIGYSSCDKSSPSPKGTINLDPPAGNYYSTLFCKINDSDWCDCSLGGGLPNWKYSGIDANYYDQNFGKPMVIQAKNTCSSNNTASYIYIYIDNFGGIGKYVLDRKEYGSYASYSYYAGTHTPCIFLTDLNNGGEIEITVFDKIKKTLSGKFHFDALQADSNRQAKIMQGTIINMRYN